MLYHLTRRFRSDDACVVRVFSRELVTDRSTTRNNGQFLNNVQDGERQQTTARTTIRPGSILRNDLHEQKVRFEYGKRSDAGVNNLNVSGL